MADDYDFSTRPVLIKFLLPLARAFDVGA